MALALKEHAGEASPAGTAMGRSRVVPAGSSRHQAWEAAVVMATSDEAADTICGVEKRRYKRGMEAGLL